MEQPLWLLGLALIVPVVWTGLAWFPATMSRARAWSAVVLRSVLIALIVLILGGASAVHRSDRLATIALVDVSDSVRQYAEVGVDGAGRPLPPLEGLRAWIERAVNDPARRPDDLFGAVVFDGESIAIVTPRPVGGGREGASREGAGGAGPGAPGALDFSLDYRMSEGTNIESAMRLASAMFPPDAARRLVLISDGLETEGDALAAARELASGTPGTPGGRPGVGGSGLTPVDVAPLSYAVKNEVMVEAVDAPNQAAAGSLVPVRVLLRATDAVSGELFLKYDGELIDLSPGAPGRGKRVELPAGTSVQTLEVKLGPGTVHRLEPVFEADDRARDRLTANNSAETFVVTPGKGTVLVVDGVGEAREGSEGLILPRALAEAGIDVKTIAPAAMPGDVLSLQAYDLVILENVASEELARSTHQLLADSVTDLGAGLVMVGGDKSFGAGGWKGSPLEPILPVSLDLPEQLIAPSAAVVLVIDNSGSMAQPVLGGSRTQQEIANEGAAVAIQTLDKTDLVAVIAFNSESEIVIPMGRNTDAELSAKRVRNIGTGGGTNLYPALELAGTLLSEGDAARASVRQIIALTDGRSQGEPEDGYKVAEKLKDAGIKVSTIAVGDQADGDTLQEIAVRGDGRYYRVYDPNLLPRIFIKEIRVVRKPLIRETPFVPRNLGSGSALVAGMEAPFPPLRGLVLTQRRADPKVINALATPEGEPVLSHWFAGRGQVAAFTSDGGGRWARDWVKWPGYASMWTQIARVIARPAAARSADLTVEVVGPDLVVRLDATDDKGRPRDLLEVPGTVYTPDGKKVALRLAQVGPGAYEARMAAPGRGNYFVALQPRQGEKRLPPVVGGASRAIGTEFRATRSNVGLLKQIAEATGGRVLDITNPEGAGLFERGEMKPVRAASPIWRLLLVWSLAVLLLDVGTRRVAWDRLLSRHLVAEVREQAVARVRQRAERAAATASALRKASGRGDEAPATGEGAPDAAAAAVKERVRRPAPDAAPAQVALSEEEKAAAAARLEERRQRLRRQMLERLSRPEGPVAPQAEGGGAGRPKPGEGEEPRVGPASEGLRAAKKRATKRFEGPGGKSEGESGGGGA